MPKSHIPMFSGLALSPDKRPAAGAYRQITEDNKRLLKGSLNPLRPYFPHGKFK